MSAPEISGFTKDLPDRADVVVIGAGIAGTSAALHLARAGVRVALLERYAVGQGATAAAVGVLSPPLRQPFHETVHFRGEDTARLIWEFALRSVRGLGDALTELGEAEAAGLDLSGGYVLAESHTLHQMELSHRALEKAGLPVQWITADEVGKLVGGRGLRGGYVIEGGGAISPGPTARALARGAQAAGALVVEEVEVSDLERSDGSFVCRTDRGDLVADMVVYATHVDSRRFSPFLGDEIVPIRGQGMRVASDVPSYVGSFSTHWKLNVWRTAPDGSLYLGGWRHDAWDRSYWKKRPVIDEHLQADVRVWFENTFRGGEALQVDDRWSGIFGWTADYLPLVGPLPGRPGELVISGFSGGGLPLAFEAGRVISSIVTEGDQVRGGELLNPRRFT
jgi:glycine/D-amino acid oxidase-like deaminating enzyme